MVVVDPRTSRVRPRPDFDTTVANVPYAHAREVHHNDVLAAQLSIFNPERLLRALYHGVMSLRWFSLRHAWQLICYLFAFFCIHVIFEAVFKDATTLGLLPHVAQQLFTLKFVGSGRLLWLHFRCSYPRVLSMDCQEAFDLEGLYGDDIDLLKMTQCRDFDGLVEVLSRSCGEWTARIHKTFWERALFGTKESRQERCRDGSRLGCMPPWVGRRVATWRMPVTHDSFDRIFSGKSKMDLEGWAEMEAGMSSEVSLEEPLLDLGSLRKPKSASAK